MTSRVLRRLRNPSPDRSRGMGRAGQTWSPILLSPYAWYDAHLGGSSTQITDSSANARAATTFAAAGNSPLWLQYTGTPYVYLPGIAGNTIACTAPANTASYSAVPLGGGAATTGAASPGAFTFSTVGSWESVSLLTAGAAELAKFRAVDSTQTGHTDTYSVAWTVNRATSGRKSVVLSSAASSGRSVVLFGTDDYATIPNGAIVPAHPSTWVVVFRTWATHAANMRVFSNRTGGTTVGETLYLESGGGASYFVQDGSTSSTAGIVPSIYGTRSVVSTSRTGSNNVRFQLNNGTAVVTSTAVGSSAGGTGYLLGANPGPANYADMTFEALLTFNRVLTADEISQLVAFYRGG